MHGLSLCAQTLQVVHKQFTCTVDTISFKAFPTCAVEASICITTVGIDIACMCPQFTLIDICKYKVVE